MKRKILVLSFIILCAICAATGCKSRREQSTAQNQPSANAGAKCPQTAGAFFAASPEPIKPGESTTLSWKIPDASRVVIIDVRDEERREVKLSEQAEGNMTITPDKTSTYELTATGADGCAPVVYTLRVKVESEAK